MSSIKRKRSVKKCVQILVTSTILVLLGCGCWYVFDRPSDVFEPKIKGALNTDPFSILHEISPEGQLIVTSATCGYLDMLLNWIAQMQSLNLNNFLVIAEDLKAYEYLLTVIPRQTVMSSAFGRPFGQKATKAAVFDSPDYSWCSRPYYLNKLIQQNMTVIWIDSDAMLLKDPFVVVPHSEDDVIVSDDEPILAPIRSLTMPHYYCSCFVKVRPTPGAAAVLNMWARQCGSRSKNQPALNKALDMMAGSVQWDVLPRRVFPCGYDADRLTVAGAPGWDAPAWVHANWRIGEESKELFLKRVGMWHNLRAPVHCGA
jgi:Nucleotide-diphospho-sugar transferase